MTKQDAQRAFRNAVGTFATGVTIATTKAEDGGPVGVTASSFNSVSLDPPLVLWSLARNSLSHDAFLGSGHFAVHVLTAAQEDLSNRFARSGADKFDGIGWSEGVRGSPVLDEYAALFQCVTRYRYDGGDHVILVGEVIEYEANDAAPLLFHGGRYAERRARLSAAGTSVDLDEGRFTDDFLSYLIARAHYQLSFPTRRHLEQSGVSHEDYLVLAALSMEAPLSDRDLSQIVRHTGFLPSFDHLDNMARRGLLIQIDNAFDMAERGRELFIETLADGKAFEEDLSSHLSAGEIFEAKRVLKKIIDLTGSGIPLGWRDEDARL